ncbi:DUF1569 domain-containing protein [Stieleria varia]|uniref:DUF1569 domain-containing protein n=1 Tax=Stieleria varia TaxID=2528005 RepID=A0A5C6B9F4_9BACT|nr:DUF1569 domain-containing protein [Stieleria varia]TWU07949.1 hypothetical protein Pla52n_05260 [Stieleria varia]
MPEMRSLRFETFDEAFEEAESLSRGKVRTTGNYTFGQIIEHLARTLDIVSGQRRGPTSSLAMRMFARLVRPFVLKKARPGFKLPVNAQSIFWPTEDVPTDQAMDHLRSAARVFQNMSPLPTHPFFGSMSRQQHDQLQCRHFELHLGFVHPD